MTTIASDNQAGNLTTDRQGYMYQYDYENRIVKIIKSGPTTVAEYSYDALGRRVEKKDCVTSGNTRRYYYDKDWRILDEYDGSGTLKRPSAADMPWAGFGLMGGGRRGKIGTAL